MSRELPSAGAKFAPEVTLEGSPNSLDSAIETYPEAIGDGVRRESVIKVTRISSILTVLVSGVALFAMDTMLKLVSVGTSKGGYSYSWS